MRNPKTPKFRSRIGQATGILKAKINILTGHYCYIEKVPIF
jgi:hypothetical protein